MRRNRLVESEETSESSGTSSEDAEDSSEREKPKLPKLELETLSDIDNDAHEGFSMAMQRQATFMTEVMSRIDELPGTRRHSTTHTRTPRLPSTSFGSEGRSYTETQQFKPLTCCGFPVEKADLPGIPFRKVVMLSIVFSLLLVCVGMFLPQVLIRERYEATTIDVLNSLEQREQTILKVTTRMLWRRSFAVLLREITCSLQTYVFMPPRRAVDELASALDALRSLDPGFDGSTQANLLLLLRLTVKQMTRWPQESASMLHVPKTCNLAVGRPSSLFVTFKNEAQAGTMVNCSGFWGFLASGGIPGETTTIRNYPVDPETYQELGPGLSGPYLPTSRPYWRMQERIRENITASGQSLASVPTRYEWTDLYPFISDGDGIPTPGITLTRPVAYCGDYSCFDGVVAASMSLDIASVACRAVWNHLQNLLESQAYSYALKRSTSSVFIVNHVSTQFPEQEGLLIGTSQVRSKERVALMKATESPHLVTRTAARAILWRYRSWSAPDLQTEEIQFLAVQSSVKISPELDRNATETAHFETCRDGELNDYCMHIGLSSIDFYHNESRWLLVVVLPASAFVNATVRDTEEIYANMQEEEENLALRARNFGTYSLIAFILITLISVSLSLCLGSFVIRPLVQLSKMMRRLSKFNFQSIRDRAELDGLVFGKRSRIREVASLQREFAHLSRGMEVFAKFVPETVVRSIVDGDERFQRLHVEKKVVTIMFSDVKDFTTISERLDQRDLLLVLTKYLTVMTEIVEAHQGVVAEVLGDGLLAFWNTPDDVPDHAAEACAAALEQLDALSYLNKALHETLQRAGLPNLAVRIGVHTGEVLSGNLGSLTKMKFGCLGDPVNLASRLEGLCKVYGVDIIVSAATKGAAGPSLQTRRLDLVQVKGRHEATEIFELLGMDGAQPEYSPSTERLVQARLYEQALVAYQAARFPESLRLVTELLRQNGRDAAAERLDRRLRGYLAEDGHTIVGLSAEDLASWTGIVSMTDK